MIHWRLSIDNQDMYLSHGYQIHKETVIESEVAGIELISLEMSLELLFVNDS